MAFILHGCGDRFCLQSTETGGFFGSLFAGNPGESARAFSYDYGTCYSPQEIVNLGEFPQFAEMPFLALDCSIFNHELLPKLNPIEDRKVFNFLSDKILNQYQ
jgi:hypothetical protein